MSLFEIFKDIKKLNEEKQRRELMNYTTRTPSSSISIRKVSDLALGMHIPVSSVIEKLKSAGIEKQAEDSLSQDEVSQWMYYLRCQESKEKRIKSKTTAQSITQHKLSQTYVIDGMNVCWWYSQAHPSQASIQPLLTLLIALLENGDDFYCVFDASVTHTVGENNKEEHAKIIESLLHKYPTKFYRVTAATRADGVILHDANHHNRNIISNDTYRDYKEKYSWLSDKYTDRLVQGNLQPSGLITLDKLAYGQLSLQTDAGLALNRLNELLAIQNQL